MENTVEAILAHGDQAPSLLVTNLKNGKATEAQDSALARQLEAQDRHAHQQTARLQQQQQQLNQLQQQPAVGQSTTSPAGRGLPTELPADFLRVPGYHSSSSTSPASVMDQDEALAHVAKRILLARAGEQSRVCSFGQCWSPSDWDTARKHHVTTICPQNERKSASTDYGAHYR